MGHIEIERRFLPPALPDGFEHHPHKEFLQGYLSTSPTAYVRYEGETYVFAYKGSGLLKREEYNLPLTAENFIHLLRRRDGLHIRKTRCLIPLSGTAYITKFGHFQGELAGPLLVEVEPPDEASARTFTPPAWFSREVTGDPRYQGSSLSHLGFSGEGKA